MTVGTKEPGHEPKSNGGLPVIESNNRRIIRGSIGDKSGGVIGLNYM